MYRLVSQYVDERQKRGELRGESPRAARCILTNFVCDLGVPLQKLTQKQIQDWVDNLPVADSTKRTKLAYVRGFTKWLAETGRLPADPAKSVKAPRAPKSVPRGLTREAVEKLFASLPDARAEAMVSLMVMEGLRAGGVAGLQLGDIDRSSRTMIVTEKGNKERLIPITDDSWAALTRYLAQHPASAGPVFRKYPDHRRPVSPNWVSTNVSQWFYDAGIKQHAHDGISAHALRHTFGTELADAGVDLRVIQELMGHSTIASTMLYTGRAGRDQLRAAVSGRSYRRSFSQ